MNNKIQLWVLFALIVTAIIISGLSFLDRGNVKWGGLLQNLGTELAGAFITYWLLTKLLGTQQEKEELIGQMGSKYPDTSLPAVEALRRKGWLLDGSLQNRFFNSAYLENANLTKANLAVANLSDANLAGASLIEANLAGADLRGANLSRTTLMLADLQRAKLVGADLKGANLSSANLKGTFLQYVDFTGAKLEEAKLENAQYREYYTIWPDGFDPKAAGAILVDSFGNPIDQDDIF